VSNRPLAQLLVLSLVTGAPVLAADLSIQNTRAAGFSDQTPVTPVGLNFGTTRGQQALIVFQATAAMWGAELVSSIPIPINCQFTSAASNSTFDCTSDGTVLAFTTPGGAETSPSFPNPAAAYVLPLANALANSNFLPGGAQFVVNINGDLGTPACNFPAAWYFGLDTAIPTDAISLFTTLLHEFGHGLGFFSFVNLMNGVGAPYAIFDYHTFDVDAGIPWTSETSDVRRALINTPNSIAFDGEAVRAAIPTFLAAPPNLVTTFNATATQRNFAEGEFSGALVGSGPLVAANPLDACSQLSNAAEVNGKFALIERSLADAGVVCSFLSKAERAQDAGAIGVIIYDYLSEGLIQMAGSPPIDIPATFVSNLDGTTLQTELGQGAVTVSFGSSAGISNTDPTGTRVLLYTPSAVSSGSSVSHWNSNSYPHTLLLEFANQPDIRLNMDFTPDVMSDMGWTVNTGLGVSVVKMLDPEVPAGAPFRYLIALVNRRTTAIDNVSLNLSVPQGTTFIANASSPAGCETAFPCNIGTMAAGQVMLVMATVQAPTNASSPFVATATVTIPGGAQAGDNLTASASQTVASGGDLAVTVTGTTPVVAGQNATVTTILTNNGPGDAAEVVLNGVLSGSGANPPVFSANAGQCSDAFPCSLGTVAKGASVTVTSTFNVPTGFQNGVTFTATATASTPDSNAANNTASFAFSTTGSSSSGGGCSSTGGPATMLGLLALGLALLARSRRNTF
jgi:MYXO-CTERM domain-containing protein